MPKSPRARVYGVGTPDSLIWGVQKFLSVKNAATKYTGVLIMGWQGGCNIVFCNKSDFTQNFLRATPLDSTVSYDYTSEN
jgi:hypothetical protein